MDEMQVALKELDLPVSKHHCVKPDIVNDCREICTYFDNSNENGSAAKQLKVIESFSAEIGFDLFVTRNEIEESTQAIFRQSKV